MPLVDESRTTSAVVAEPNAGVTVSRLRRFWENVRPFISACAYFFIFFIYFFFEVEISSGSLISLSMPGSVHSGSTS